MSRLIVDSNSASIAGYTTDQQNQLISYSNALYRKLTRKLYERCGDYTRTYSMSMGRSGGMLYDVTRIIELFKQMNRRIDQFCIDGRVPQGADEHYRALGLANYFCEDLLLLHIDLAVQVSESFWYLLY